MKNKLFRAFDDLKMYNPNIQSQGDKVCLHLNENIYPPPLDCLAAVAGMPEINLNEYERGGTLLLEQRLAKLHGVDIGNILIDNGSCEVLKHTFLSLNRDDTKVLMPAHGWAYNNKMIHLNDLDVAYYELLCDENGKEYSFDLGDMKNRIDKFCPDVLLIVTPNAFTGNLMARNDLCEILKKCSEKTLVIVDQAYAEYSYNDDIVIREFIAKYDNVIFSRTLSKFYALANIRIGYAISNVGIIDHVKNFAPVFGTSGVCQTIACHALDNLAYYEEVKKKNDKIKRQFLSNMHTLKNFTAFHSEANFVLIKVQSLDTSRLLDEIRDEGIVLGNCKGYGLDHHIRVTIGDEKTMETLFQLFMKMDASLDKCYLYNCMIKKINN